MPGQKLIWMDLEMTGLDPERDRIIEIAVLVTDADLETIIEGPELVIHQPKEVLDLMDAWNRKHHGDSGLIKKVRESEVSEADAEKQVLAFLEEHCDRRKVPLCGNSVHQDKRFLAKYMPSIEAFLHYRIVDVSTLKELAGRWYPEEYGKRPGKRASHRAMDDIRESVNELRFYREAIFK